MQYAQIKRGFAPINDFGFKDSMKAFRFNERGNIYSLISKKVFSPSTASSTLLHSKSF